MTTGPGQPRSDPLFIWHLMTSNQSTKATPLKSRSKQSSNAKSLARVRFLDARKERRGAKHVTGGGLLSKLYVRGV
jgi:hypothetical protein